MGWAQLRFWLTCSHIHIHTLKTVCLTKTVTQAHPCPPASNEADNKLLHALLWQNQNQNTVDLRIKMRTLMRFSSSMLRSNDEVELYCVCVCVRARCC